MAPWSIDPTKGSEHGKVSIQQRSLAEFVVEQEQVPLGHHRQVRQLALRQAAPQDDRARVQVSDGGVRLRAGSTNNGARLFEALLQASPLAVVLFGLWKLPEWTRKWIAVARDLREFRSGR
jgi:hypothetical protein